MRIYATEFDVSFKDDLGDDPVTNADRASNAIVCDALAEAFPKDVIVAEESAVPAGFERAERCWFVDPLDGTKEFVARNGEFCVMVGLAIAGRAALGIVVVPALPLIAGAPPGYALVGEVGVGAWAIDANGAERALAPAEPAEPSRPRVVVSRSRRSARLDAIYRHVGVPREIPTGSVGVKIAKVLVGDADAYVHPAAVGKQGGPKKWDVCAPEAIAAAAGAAFTNETGETTDYASAGVAHDRGIVVAAPRFHRTLLDAIGRASVA